MIAPAQSDVSPLAVDKYRAAELLSLHPETVARFARSGEIPSAVIGRCRRYRVADLDAWLKSKTVDTVDVVESVPK